MPKRLPPIILSLLFISCPLNGSQTGSDSTKHKVNPLKNIPQTFFKDFVKIGRAPFRMSQQDYVLFSSFVALNAGLIWLVDESVDEEFARENDHFYNKLLQAATWPGDVFNRMQPEGFAAALMGATAASGILLQDKKLLQTSLLLLESYIITGMINRLAKISIGRARPLLNKGPHFRNSFYTKSDRDQFYSMPSGHTSSIFTLMAVLINQYHSKFVRYPAYALMASVALQRIETRKHWLSDVVVGAALGYRVAGHLVNKRQPGHAIVPYFGGNKIGLAVQF